MKPKAILPEPEVLETKYSYTTGGVDTVTLTDARSTSMLSSIDELAPLLWRSDYRSLFEQERLEMFAWTVVTAPASSSVSLKSSS